MVLVVLAVDGARLAMLLVRFQCLVLHSCVICLTWLCLNLFTAERAPRIKIGISSNYRLVRRLAVNLLFLMGDHVFKSDEKVARVELARVDSLAAAVLAASHVELMLSIVVQLVIGVERAHEHLLFVLICHWSLSINSCRCLSFYLI